MMTCREILDFLMDYLDGNLSSAQRAVFEEHLAVCPACVAYLHNYRQTVKLGKAASAADPRDDVPEDLVQAVLAARKQN
jgi:anti-sigma factor RsiW